MAMLIAIIPLALIGVAQVFKLQMVCNLLFQSLGETIIIITQSINQLTF